MSRSTEQKNRRILVIDDNRSIHDDFRKVLSGRDLGGGSLERMEASLFGEAAGGAAGPEPFEIDSAYQGDEGFERVREARQAGCPYALAFVDVRMPPGWDGIETVKRLWEVDPDLQAVICTAYSDYSWADIIHRIGQSDRLLILKKPFDSMEVRQMACALTEKSDLAARARLRMDELERAVRERTTELTEQKDHLVDALAKLHEAHAQLLQVDKMASIGQLAAGVAHEINNPIGFISSNLNSLGQYVEELKRVLDASHDLMVDALAASPAAVDRARALQQVRGEVDIDYVMQDLGELISESVEGTQRVRQIVSDLRDFSHVDNPDVNEEDINRLIDKTINVAWNELKYKTEVVREYGKIPPIPCYGGKLGQVILNLLVNAAHAIEKHGTITVRTGHQEGRVWIEVADTGCGIPQGHLDRIFEPFFTTKAVGKGTGLGLHLAYKIVSAHGGRISVNSHVGKGTTFRIELPVAGPPAVAEAKA